MAVSGDTVVVGAYREQSNATGVNGNQADNSIGEAGAAYVFVRNGAGVWSQQAFRGTERTAIANLPNLIATVGPEVKATGTDGLVSP